MPADAAARLAPLADEPQITAEARRLPKGLAALSDLLAGGVLTPRYACQTLTLWNSWETSAIDG